MHRDDGMFGDIAMFVMEIGFSRPVEIEINFQCNILLRGAILMVTFNVSRGN